jgi:hypothetical protein
MNKARISNITQTKNGTETEKNKKRRKWIKYLQQHSYKIKISTNKKQNLIKWVEKIKIPQSQIDKIIIDDIWRKSNMINYLKSKLNTYNIFITLKHMQYIYNTVKKLYSHIFTP